MRSSATNGSLTCRCRGTSRMPSLRVISSSSVRPSWFKRERERERGPFYNWSPARLLCAKTARWRKELMFWMLRGNSSETKRRPGAEQRTRATKKSARARARALMRRGEEGRDAPRQCAAGPAAAQHPPRTRGSHAPNSSAPDPSRPRAGAEQVYEACAPSRAARVLKAAAQQPGQDCKVLRSGDETLQEPADEQERVQRAVVVVVPLLSNLCWGRGAGEKRIQAEVARRRHRKQRQREKRR